MGLPAKKLQHGEGLKKTYRDIIEATQANDLDGVKQALKDDRQQIHKVDGKKMNALHWAVFRNNIFIAKELIEFRYVDENGQHHRLDVEAVDGLGRKPIEIAIDIGNEDMINLISSVVFPEMFDPDSEWNTDTPIKKVIEFPGREPE